MSPSATFQKVERIVRESLKLGSDVRMDDHASLLDGDHDFDSLDVLLVVTNIEKEFGIKIPDREVSREAFATMNTLVQFVDSQLVSNQRD